MPKKIVQSIQRVLKLLCLHKIALFFFQKRQILSLHFVWHGCRITQDVVLEARKERYIKGFEV